MRSLATTRPTWRILRMVASRTSTNAPPIFDCRVTGFSSCEGGDRAPLSLRHGLLEPIFESNRAELSFSGGNERTLAQQRSVVTRTRISDDCAWIVVRLEPSLDQRVETKWFRPCHLDDAVHRLPHRNSRDRHGDIVGGH